MSAIRLPKGSDDEKKARKVALVNATKHAIEIPFEVMQTAYDCYGLIDQMAEQGNPASVSDAGVGALCVHAAVHSAYLNVLINCADFSEKTYVDQMVTKAQALLARSSTQQADILKKVEKIIKS